MNKFVKNIKKICKKNNKVAMFIDMDGTILEYEVFKENVVNERMQEKYSEMKPLQYVIKTIKRISKIENIDLYILSLSRTKKINEEKIKWLKKYVPFITEKNYIILTKELNEYSNENRNVIKAEKIKEIQNKYDYSILLDDDHKILKEAQNILDNDFRAFHISSILI